MARFLGVGVWTDIQVAVPESGVPAATRLAFFRADDLISCVASLSPTEPESLVLQVARDDPRAVHLALGTVVRLTFEGGTGDREWDVITLSDASGDNVLTVEATAIFMRLSRVVYMGAVTGTGEAAPDWTAVQLTATEWLDLLVFPALDAAGIPFTIGTVDNTTTRFTMSGEWSSVMEIVREICEPGRAAAEPQLRTGGDYGYLLDLRTTIGGTADTVRVRTAVNLMETRRQRSLIEVATRIHPRGSADSVATRTMSHHVWEIETVVNGTTLALKDPWGGDDPILYDDQLNGLYVAWMHPGDGVFASQEVTDSVASTQRITVVSTTGMTAGEWVRFFEGTGQYGARMTSLIHPTLILHAALNGYGDRAQVLDRPALVADTNLVKNPLMQTWTVAADPPDGWTEFVDGSQVTATFSKSTADVPFDGANASKVVTSTDVIFGAYTGDNQAAALYWATPLIPTWGSSLRLYVASVWIKVNAKPSGTTPRVRMYVFGYDTVAYTIWSNMAVQIGEWVGGTDAEDVWTRYESAPFAAIFAQTGADGGLPQIRVELCESTTYPDWSDNTGAWRGLWNVATTYAAADYVAYAGGIYECTTAPSTGNTPPGTDWTLSTDGTASDRRVRTGWEVLVSAATFAEAPTVIADREGSGGTELWQAANDTLPDRVTAIRGYDLGVADLWADDAATYATLAFTPGGTVEVTDTDLNVTTSLRLVEYHRDYLAPLASQIRVGHLADRFTALTEAGRALTTLSTG